MIEATTQVRSLFFALQPDDSVATQLMQAARRAKAAGLFADARPAHTHHLTLHFLGAYSEFPPALVREAKAAAASTRCAPFEFTLDRIESFGRAEKAPCVLLTSEADDAPLRGLHDVLGAMLRAAGIGRCLERRQFAPHVTLAYARPGSAPLHVEPIIWPVREFVLLESLVGRSTHNRLGVWPLVG